MLQARLKLLLPTLAPHIESYASVTKPTPFVRIIAYLSYYRLMTELLPCY